MAPPSNEFNELVASFRAKPFSAESTPVDEQRRDFEALAAAMADPPEVRREAVDAGGIPAEFAVPAAPDSQGDEVLLWVHGGGFTLGSVASYRDMAARLSVGTGRAVLTFDYRLAPEHVFPAALDDTLTALDWLLTDREPTSVVVGGDSVGGGLAVAAVMACRDRSGVVPAGISVVSPKVDLAQTGRSVHRNADLDPVVSPEGTAENARRYLGPEGDPLDPLASPLFGDLAGLPPTSILVGTDEVLLDDSLRLARRLREAEVVVDLDVWPDMIHILPFFAPRVPEGRAAMAAICRMIRNFTPIPGPTPAVLSS